MTMPLRKSAVVALPNGVFLFLKKKSILLHLLSNKDTRWLSQHYKHYFLHNAPPVIAQNYIPEPIFAGQRNQEAVASQDTTEFLSEGCVECMIRLTRANLLTKGQIG